jgi:transcriptional regulator with XRE-family HTH domain
MQETTYVQLRRFAKAVRAAREELGISQEKFAERCGFTPTHVGKIERAEMNVTFETISHICRATKLRQSELFSRAKL